MGLFDDISNSVSDIFSSGDSTTDWGGLIDTGVDWLGDNMGDILDFGGTAVEQYSRQQQQQELEDISKKQAKELLRAADQQAALYKYDAGVAEDNAVAATNRADVAFKRNADSVDQILSAQTARYGKAGVAPGEGTPMKVAIETAHKGAMEGLMIKHNGAMDAQKLNSLSMRYQMAANETLLHAAKQVNILEDATNDKLTALEYQAWSSGLAKVGEIGLEQAWWV